MARAMVERLHAPALLVAASPLARPAPSAAGAAPPAPAAGGPRAHRGLAARLLLPRARPRRRLRPSRGVGHEPGVPLRLLPLLPGSLSGRLRGGTRPAPRGPRLPEVPAAGGRARGRGAWGHALDGVRPDHPRRGHGARAPL